MRDHAIGPRIAAPLSLQSMDLDAMLPRAVVGARVRRAPVPSTLPNGRRLADWLTAVPNEVLVEHSGIRVLVRGTDEVLVDLDDGADLALVAPLLYGHVTRTLLLHAGTFSLHASVVRLDGAVVALGGHNGAGKSTTAAALSQIQGGALLVDDVAPTRVVDGRVQVQVFERPVHLTLDALDRLGLSATDAEVVIRGARGKVAMPVTGFGGPAGDARWVEVDRLFALLPESDEPEHELRDGRAVSREVVAREISGAERLRWVVRLSNVTGLAALGDRAGDYFAWATAVADVLATTEIARSEGTDTLAEVCAAVLAAVAR
jgi:hypothetical protein